MLLGWEPFGSERVSFGSPGAVFSDEVRRYWTETRGVSLQLSAKVVQTLLALREGELEVRFIPGATKLHAKLYVGDDAATIGSSNFTHSGLSAQFEANARFERSDEPERYAECVQLAEHYWSVGESWTDQFEALLNDLLAFVPWREALARACADLLEGQWASRYLPGAGGATRLWPSQLSGIAEALWVLENVGSVLVADATGSGKTRMGAHLTRAVRDRLWSTGRVRSDLTVLVCPPASAAAVVDRGRGLRSDLARGLARKAEPLGWRRIRSGDTGGRRRPDPGHRRGAQLPDGLAAWSDGSAVERRSRSAVHRHADKPRRRRPACPG